MNDIILAYFIPFFLCMEIFFLSISGGVTFIPYRWAYSVKISGIFSLTQFAAGALALLIAQLMYGLIEGFASITGLLLVTFISVKMIREAYVIKNEERTFVVDDSSIIWPLALATSLNTFLLFLGLGFLSVSFTASLVVLVLSSLLFSQLGLFIGSHYRPQRLGRSSKFGGGLLILILTIVNYFL